MDDENTTLAEELGAGATMRAARDLVESYVKPQIVSLREPITGVEALARVDRNGIAAIPANVFDDYRSAPRWREGVATALDLDSFIEHTQRYADPDSLVFANNDRSAPSVVTVFDYHRAGPNADPRHMQHRVLHRFPLSDEWKAWTALDGKTMDMASFAAFLEDHIIDVMDSSEVSLTEEQQRFVDRLGGRGRIATPAKLMEIATGLRVLESVETVNAVNLDTGEVQMTFNNEHRQAEGQLTVPSLFAIGIPVFVNGDAYQVLVRLRYRSSGGKVLFFFNLWRTDRVFDHAFDESLSKVREKTGLDVILGKPEE
jgi:uncharacterized protein YfdQ (DUF2303 family)